jgi:hypothetical protein
VKRAKGRAALHDDARNYGGESLEMGGLNRQTTRVLRMNQWLRFIKRKHKVNQGLWLILHLDRNQWRISIVRVFLKGLDQDPRARN